MPPHTQTVRGWRKKNLRINERSGRYTLCKEPDELERLDDNAIAAAVRSSHSVEDVSRGSGTRGKRAIMYWLVAEITARSEGNAAQDFQIARRAQRDEFLPRRQTGGIKLIADLNQLIRIRALIPATANR
jgi:hypothetical protein